MLHFQNISPGKRERQREKETQRVRTRLSLPIDMFGMGSERDVFQRKCSHGAGIRLVRKAKTFDNSVMKSTHNIFSF